MRCSFDWSARLVRVTGCAALLLSTSIAWSADAEKELTQQPEVLPARQGTEEGPAQVVAKPAITNEVFDQGPVAQWIWGASNDQNYVFQTKFTGPAKATRLKATADNACTVWINGTKVLGDDDWAAATEVDITKHVKAGENVIQAEASNAGGPAAFILKLALTGEDGKTQYVVSDSSWKSSAKRDSTELADVRVVAKLGDAPYGDPLAKSAVEGAAGPTDLFNLQPGFQVERLFTVPKDLLGSWVCITFDNKGRLIASDQGDKGLCRITVPAIGSQDPVKVERLDVKISAAQGMLYAFDALYISVNGGQGSGLYRAKDTNGDDQYDEVVQLAKFQGGGEHGPHSLRLSPDGQSIYVVCGNHTLAPEKIDASRLPTNWSEDHLLPRQWDANGHARGILAPGGWVAKTDPEGKTWEIVSVGYRNQFDFAFNADGEMFVYDSDMEWDYGTSWYRPTRVNHAPSGSEMGWRSGTGVWPSYYIDSLPAMVDIGPGSPVGVTFGYGAKFPAKYQKALFICDWTFGTMYAIHQEPNGATYKGVKEEFISRTPLPLTDNAIGPDGAMYFTVGGRGAQSELFRVTYVGKQPTDPVDAHDAQFADQRALRQQLEQYHKPSGDGAL
ncbi:MAG: putative heme-binding protein, partial [Planctomycetaceae bacterium]|nr:putative heme-binding protein [Planctomycetaceae bacterium]